MERSLRRSSTWECEENNMKRALLTAAALILVTSIPAYPHGGGVLRLATVNVAGGGLSL